MHAPRTTAKSKETRSNFVLFAVIVVLIALEFLFLQNLSSQDFYDETLNISRIKNHSPNDLFLKEKIFFGLDSSASVEDEFKERYISSRDINPNINLVVTPVTPTDAQLELVRLAKDRGLQNVDDKGPILEILFQAGIKIKNKNELDQETLDLLPTWSQVQNLYGTEPNIYGLERCKEFRDAVKPTTRFFGMAGTFNTGTNLIADLMKYNCQISERMEVYGEKSKGVRWQVPWGKHMMARFRGTKHTTETDSDVPHENILPLVSIRDPYSWMQSMCRHHYAAMWPHKKNHCPNLIATETDINSLPYLHNLYGRDVVDEKLVPVLIKYSKDNIHHHLSLAHLYSEWYGDYFKADYPRIMVRFEDLLFYGEQVTRAVCKCGGGVPRIDNGRSGSFAHISESAKKGPNAHGAVAERTNLVGALIKYGRYVNRTDSMTKEDLIASRRYFNSEIMRSFGYTHPT